MRTGLATRRGTTGFDTDEDYESSSKPTADPWARRTQLTSVEPDWLTDVVSDWDDVFGERSTTAARAVDSGRRVNTCLVGDQPVTIAWSGRQRLILGATTAAPMIWQVFVSHSRDDAAEAAVAITAEDGVAYGDVTYGGALAHGATSFSDAPSLAELAALLDGPRRASHPADSSPNTLTASVPSAPVPAASDLVAIAAASSQPTVADVVEAVQTVSSALGVAERDVLNAAGIRERTYYHWKRYPGTALRAGSQANLWGVVTSVAAIVAQYDRLAARWLRADLARFQLFLDGQHARLALLAAGADADVRLPSDTLDAHGVGVFGTDVGVLAGSPDGDSDGVGEFGSGGQAGDHVNDGDEEVSDEEQSRIERLKRFRARHPIAFSHDEDGAPLSSATGLQARFYADEPEDELILNDDDE